MPTPSVPDGFGRLSMLFNHSETSHTSVMTQHFVNAGGDDPSLIAGVLRTLWDDSFPDADLGEEWTKGPFNVYTTIDGVEYFGTDANVQTGQDVQPRASVGTTVAMRRRAPGVGKSQRGRMFLVGGYIATSAIDGAGNLSTVFRNALDVLWAAFNSDMSDAGYIPVLIGAGGEVRGPIIVASGATSIAPKVTWLRTRNQVD